MFAYILFFVLFRSKTASGKIVKPRKSMPQSIFLMLVFQLVHLKAISLLQKELF